MTHRPDEDAQVERWVAWHRDQYDATDYVGAQKWEAIDAMLTDLRRHTARGLPLYEHIIDRAGPHNVGIDPRWTPVDPKAPGGPDHDCSRDHPQADVYHPPAGWRGPIEQWETR